MPPNSDKGSAVSAGRASRPVERRSHPRVARIGVRFLRQLFVVGSGLLAYSLVRGATQGKPALAVRNAHRLLDVERFLGLAWERMLQDGVIRSRGATMLLNGIYIYGHWPMIAVTLGWLLTRHPAAFVRTRNAMLASGAVGLVFFITFPVAPPRLAELGLVDTVTAQSHAYRLLQPPTLTDQYAAMPSLHVGWNLLLALAIATTAERTWQRAAAMAMPVVMTAAVVLTANHYILDAAVGAALTGSAWLLTGRIRR